MPSVSKRLLPLCLAGVLVACGGAESDVPAADEAPAATDAAAATTVTTGDAAAAVTAAAPATDAAPAGVVPEALDFSAPLVGGGEIELGALAGRPVLLWFWAPW